MAEGNHIVVLLSLLLLGMTVNTAHGFYFDGL